jgi:hypothetical protein
VTPSLSLVVTATNADKHEKSQTAGALRASLLHSTSTAQSWRGAGFLEYSRLFPALAVAARLAHTT